MKALEGHIQKQQKRRKYLKRFFVVVEGPLSLNDHLFVEARSKFGSYGASQLCKFLHMRKM